MHKNINPITFGAPNCFYANWNSSVVRFNIIVNETAETYNLPLSAVAFRVVKEIEDYRKVFGLKRELSRLSAQIYTMNEILGRKNKAINALIRIQNYGITEDEILELCKDFNRINTGPCAT